MKFFLSELEKKTIRGLYNLTEGTTISDDISLKNGNIFFNNKEYEFYRKKFLLGYVRVNLTKFTPIMDDNKLKVKDWKIVGFAKLAGEEIRGEEEVPNQIVEKIKKAILDGKKEYIGEFDGKEFKILEIKNPKS